MSRKLPHLVLMNSFSPVFVEGSATTTSIVLKLLSLFEQYNIPDTCCPTSVSVIALYNLIYQAPGAHHVFKLYEGSTQTIPVSHKLTGEAGKAVRSTRPQ